MHIRFNKKYLNRMRLPISMRLPHVAQRYMHPHRFWNIDAALPT
jgi:hypothetical protein